MGVRTSWSDLNSLRCYQTSREIWGFFFNFFYTSYLFIFGCTVSALLCAGFLQVRWVGPSHCGGFSCWGPSAPGAQASVVAVLGLWLWHMGLVAPRHVKSSWTRDQTHVPCTGRQILNHWTTRKVPGRDVEWVFIQKSLMFKGEVQAGDRNRFETYFPKLQLLNYKMGWIIPIW